VIINVLFRLTQEHLDSFNCEVFEVVAYATTMDKAIGTFRYLLME
jgi:hypothetical protein